MRSIAARQAARTRNKFHIFVNDDRVTRSDGARRVMTGHAIAIFSYLDLLQGYTVYWRERARIVGHRESITIPSGDHFDVAVRDVANVEWVCSTSYESKKGHGFHAQFSIFSPPEWSRDRVEREFTSWLSALSEMESDDLDEESEQEDSQLAPARGFTVRLTSWDHGRGEKHMKDHEDQHAVLRGLKRVLESSDHRFAHR